MLMRACLRMVRSQSAGLRCHSRESISAATPSLAHHASGRAMKLPSAVNNPGLNIGPWQPGSFDQVPELRFGDGPYALCHLVQHPPQPRRIPPLALVLNSRTNAESGQSPRCTAPAINARTSADVGQGAGGVGECPGRQGVLPPSLANDTAWHLRGPVNRDEALARGTAASLAPGHRSSAVALQSGRCHAARPIRLARCLARRGAGQPSPAAPRSGRQSGRDRCREESAAMGRPSWPGAAARRGSGRRRRPAGGK